MIKKSKNIILYLPLILLQSCVDNTTYNYTPEMFSTIDYTLGEMLIKQCSRNSPENVEKLFNLSKNDQNILHKNFKNIYKLKSKEPGFENIKIDSLNEYVFQYTGVIIKKKKHIYINTLLKETIVNKKIAWRKNPIVICDGGPMYWGVLFNIKKEKFSELYMNSPL